MIRKLILVVLLLLVSSVAQAEVLRVGTGKTVITPDPLLPVSGGLGPSSPAREKRGELTARAIVMERGDVRVAVVSLDLLGFPSVLADRVRRGSRRFLPRTY